MIRVTSTLSVAPLDDLIGYLQSYERTAREEWALVMNEVTPFMLNELESEPGAVKYPIEWASEKQRKAFFATDGFGGGIPYTRTKKVSGAWRVLPTPNGLGMIVENPSPASQFVFGSLAASNPGGFQQPFHKNTGWQQAYETVNFWFDAAFELFDERMETRLGEFVGDKTVKRRAFTARARKPR